MSNLKKGKRFSLEKGSVLAGTLHRSEKGSASVRRTAKRRKRFPLKRLGLVKRFVRAVLVWRNARLYWEEALRSQSGRRSASIRGNLPAGNLSWPARFRKKRFIPRKRFQLKRLF